MFGNVTAPEGLHVTWKCCELFLRKAVAEAGLPAAGLS